MFCLSLLFWPVDNLTIRPFTPGAAEQAALFAAPAPLGQEFWTGYIHSVQRTPVLDLYRIVNGRIWSWREYVQSHNAGLPFQAPACGRFYRQDLWMVIEGGRQAWGRLVLRVGDAKLGRNVLAWGRGKNTAPAALHERYPGWPLVLAVERLPLAAALASRRDI